MHQPEAYESSKPGIIDKYYIFYVRHTFVDFILHSIDIIANILTRNLFNC